MAGPDQDEWEDWERHVRAKVLEGLAVPVQLDRVDGEAAVLHFSGPGIALTIEVEEACAYDGGLEELRAWASLINGAFRLKVAANKGEEHEPLRELTRRIVERLGQLFQKRWQYEQALKQFVSAGYPLEEVKAAIALGIAEKRIEYAEAGWPEAMLILRESEAEPVIRPAEEQREKRFPVPPLRPMQAAERKWLNVSVEVRELDSSFPAIIRSVCRDSEGDLFAKTQTRDEDGRFHEPSNTDVLVDEMSKIAFGGLHEWRPFALLFLPGSDLNLAEVVRDPNE